MIYERTLPDDPIRQGDIFVGLPRVDFSLEKLPVVDNGEVEERAWTEVLGDGTNTIAAVVGIRPVMAIVITQDCDAIRAAQITLCEVRAFADVERSAKDTKSPKSWMDRITQQAKKNLKWFYLPQDTSYGIAGKMAVDFQVTLSVTRLDLESLRMKRIGRLNSVADEHFRERLSEFFRRYPVDEWYALDSDELAKYKEQYPEVVPFPWQSPAEHNGPSE